MWSNACFGSWAASKMGWLSLHTEVGHSNSPHWYRSANLSDSQWGTQLWPWLELSFFTISPSLQLDPYYRVCLCLGPDIVMPNRLASNLPTNQTICWSINMSNENKIHVCSVYTCTLHCETLKKLQSLRLASYYCGFLKPCVARGLKLFIQHLDNLRLVWSHQQGIFSTQTISIIIFKGMNECIK